MSRKIPPQLSWSSVLLTTLIFSSYAGANDESVKKYRDYTPAQMKELPDGVFSTMPMNYIIAARRGLAPGADLMFARELNLLMYSGTADYLNAVKAFQSDLGEKPTGQLTVWQIDELEERAGLQRLAPVLFPDGFVSFQTEFSAVVQGTLTMLHENIAFPINHVYISCSKSQKYCEMRQLNLIVPDDSGWGQNYQVVEGDSQIFEIDKWTKTEIHGSSTGGDSCRTTSLKFNFAKNEFSMVTRNGVGDCAAVPKLKTPREVRIVDGRKIIEDEFKKVDAAAFKVLSSEFRKRVDAVNSK
jgi:hypothetical protein